MTFATENASRLLQGQLALAAETLQRAERRAAQGRGLARAAWVASALAGVVAVELVATRLAGTSVTLVFWTVGVGVIGATLPVVTAMSRRQPLPWSEVAERLDMTAGTGNAIATALDLSREVDPSPLALRAIADGIAAARSFANIEPALPAHTAPGRAGWLALAAGGVAVCLALFLPALTTAHPERVAMAGKLAIPPIDAVSTDSRRPIAVPQKGRESTQAESVSTPAQTVGTTLSARQDAATSASESPSASASAASPGESSTAQAKSAEAGAASPASPQKATDGSDSQPGGPKTSDGVNRSLAMASFGASGVGPAQSQGAPKAGAAGAGDLSSPSSAKGDANASGRQSGAGDGKGDKPQQGEGSKEGEGQSQDKDGHGAGPSHGSQQSGDRSGDQGQSSGQGAAKKSRGVAPLLLGSRQPDLLEGRRLPGSDERTKLQIPPRPSPEAPQPAVPAADRRGTESAVDVYRVPASDQRAVQQYFEQLHQDPAAAATPN